MQTCLSISDLQVYREKNGDFFHLFVPELKIVTGEILAVVGESGCGKSTLLDILALILSPSHAKEFKILFHGQEFDITKAQKLALASLRREHIGYVLQAGGLLSFLSVEDNILLPSRLAGKHPSKEDFEDLISQLGIAGHLKKKPQHLSGGQRQRVAIARAMLHNPTLILADEPTSAVDQQRALEICHIFQKLAKTRNIAVVAVSHDWNLMREFADRTVTFEVQMRNHCTISQLTSTCNAKT